jgi:ATP-dependent protease ClpP protease subunit
MKSWFRFDNAAAGGDQTVADIYILDFIGSWDDDWIARNFGYDMGVTARAFVEQLAALPSDVKTIRVYINSPGGDVQGGVNIANALREQASKGRTVETYINGIAASIASVIAMAGSKVHVADNALVMVHNPWSLAIGNAAEMRRTADILDTIRAQILATYKWHSKLTDEELIALIDGPDGQGTWMDADQAIANGFATDKVEGLKAAASISPKALAKLTVPEKFKARVDALLEQPAPKPTAATAGDVLRICRESNLDVAFAESLIADGAPLADVQSRVSVERAKRTRRPPGPMTSRRPVPSRSCRSSRRATSPAACRWPTSRRI